MPRKPDGEQQQPRLRPPPRTHDSEDAVEQRRQINVTEMIFARSGMARYSLKCGRRRPGRDVPATGRTTAAEERAEGPRRQQQKRRGGQQRHEDSDDSQHEHRPPEQDAARPREAGAAPQVWQDVEHAEEQSEISRSKNNAFIDSFVSLPGTNCRPDSRKRASANPK